MPTLDSLNCFRHEIFDSVGAGTFAATGAMSTGRLFPSATSLGSGKVLVAGGVNGGGIQTAELFDPSVGTFGATIGMVTPL